MDSKAKEISHEVFNTLEALTRRIEALEREVAALKGEPLPTAPVADPIDLELDAAEWTPTASSKAVAEPAAAISAVEDMPEPAIEPEPVTAPEPAVEDIPVPVATPEQTAAPEPASEPTPMPEEKPEPTPKRHAQADKKDQPEDLPEDSFTNLFGAEPAEPPAATRGRKKKILNDIESAQTGQSVLDVMADKAAWRHDMPGSEVKSLRSAIGLGDQVVFIRRLFRDDSALYQDSIDKLNAMSTLNEAIAFLSDSFPEWDVASEDVYRFMMAVRRKIRK